MTLYPDDDRRLDDPNAPLVSADDPVALDPARALDAHDQVILDEDRAVEVDDDIDDDGVAAPKLGDSVSDLANKAAEAHEESR